MSERNEVMGMIHGFWYSKALFVGTRLRVFDLIEKGAGSADAIAGRLSASVEGVKRLLGALAALGLVEKAGDAYRNSPAAARWLLEGREDSLVPWVEGADGLYPAWETLEEAIVSGRSPRAAGADQPREDATSFIRSMHSYASRDAVVVAGAVDLSGARELLELGSGPGTYSIYFLKRWAGLRATLVDTKLSLEEGRKLAEAHGVVERVRFLPGMAEDVKLKREYDVALMSHFLHMMSAEKCAGVVKRAAGVMREGGKLIVHELLLEDDGSGPAWTMCWALNALILFPGARPYAPKDVTGWMREAGFKKIEVMRKAELVDTYLVVGTL
jgi:SAM-dependent methyltransferase